MNGRKYEISCDDGQETHLFRLAEEVDRRIASLVASVGQVGEARLLLLLSLLLTDELEEHKKELEATRAGASPDSHMTAVDGSVGEELRGLAERIEAEDVQLTLIKYGDHRLSRPADLALLRRALGGLLLEDGA